MDNLDSHKRPGAKALIEAAGAKLVFLPPYGPNFNPIQKAFAKLKAMLRSTEQRTVSGLWDFIGLCIDLFKPDECETTLSPAATIQHDRKTL